MSATSAISLSSTFVSHAGFNGGFKSTKVTPLRFKETNVRRPGTSIVAKFDLKPPPYPFDALEPHMSKQTFEFHWGKHHRAYVDNLNKQIVGTELDGKSLEDVVRVTYNKGDFLPSFNNAAQAWNHEFFWESMKPGGGGKPSGELFAQIEKDFGSFETFVTEFKSAAATQFGSGWAWLAYKTDKLDVDNATNPLPSEDDKKLVIVKTPNAVNPLVWGYYPLLTIDVWEHAYYLDFQNRRPDYISIFMENLVSWDAVSARYESAKALTFTLPGEMEKPPIFLIFVSHTPTPMNKARLGAKSSVDVLTCMFLRKKAYSKAKVSSLYRNDAHVVGEFIDGNPRSEDYLCSLV